MSNRSMVPCSYPGCSALVEFDYCNTHLEKMVEDLIAERSGTYYPKVEVQTRASIVMVCGAPASGKTTFVHQRMKQGDVLLDLDFIHSEITGKPIHAPKTSEELRIALQLRNQKLEEYCKELSEAQTIWFVIGASYSIDRLAWKRILKPREIYIIYCPERVCKMRILNDRERSASSWEQIEAVKRWFKQYRPLADEELIQSW